MLESAECAGFPPEISTVDSTGALVGVQALSSYLWPFMIVNLTRAQVGSFEFAYHSCESATSNFEHHSFKE